MLAGNILKEFKCYIFTYILICKISLRRVFMLNFVKDGKYRIKIEKCKIQR
jgi:hypothetical protein